VTTWLGLISQGSGPTLFWELDDAMNEPGSPSDEHAAGTVLIGHEKPGGVQNQYEMLADGIFASMVKRNLTVEHMADVIGALGKQLIIYAEMQDVLLKAQIKAKGISEIRSAVLAEAAGCVEVVSS
jgi:hypothetical protein